jgi:hypothetical protein
MTRFLRTTRNWVAIAVRLVGGIYPAARICHVRPVVMKRWYGRGWVELVDKALLLAAASGISPIRLVGFWDMPSLGTRHGPRRVVAVRPRRHPATLEMGRRGGRYRVRVRMWR